jgi:hypothetical protein
LRERRRERDRVTAPGENEQRAGVPESKLGREFIYIYFIYINK